MIQTPTDLAEFVSSATSYLKLSLNVKIFVKMLKILALTANLSHIPRVQKPGLRPRALAFLYPRPGQKPAQAKGWARLGPAFFGLAWPGFWPQAGAGTSLELTTATTTTTDCCSARSRAFACGVSFVVVFARIRNQICGLSGTTNSRSTAKNQSNYGG